MREKLIEILETVVSPKELLCDGEVLVSTARVADHLIANGVKFAEDNNVPSKWIPVTERLPDDWVLCACVDNEVHILCYDYIMDDWDIWGRPNSCYGKQFVTHWMPLPEPPKGE